MAERAKAVAARLAHLEHAVTAGAAGQRGSAAVRVLGGASELADQPPLFTIALGTLAVGVVTRRPRLARTGARMLAAEAVATGLKTLLKRAVDRSRPGRALADGGATVGGGRGAGDTDFNSFPSGHTAGAVAVGLAVAHGAPAAAIPARLAAAAVGAVQLPRGKHYLSDVAVGAAIGWLAERIAGAALAAGERAWARRNASADDAEAEAHPS